MKLYAFAGVVVNKKSCLSIHWATSSYYSFHHQITDSTQLLERTVAFDIASNVKSMLFRCLNERLFNVFMNICCSECTAVYFESWCLWIHSILMNMALLLDAPGREIWIVDRMAESACKHYFGFVYKISGSD